MLNFSENLGLNADSLILLGFGICFKILCGSQKLRGLLSVYKTNGVRQISSLWKQADNAPGIAITQLPTQTGSKQKQRDVRGCR